MERRTPRNYKVRSTNGTRFFMRGYTDTAIELANTLNVTMYDHTGEVSGGDTVAYIRVLGTTITIIRELRRNHVRTQGNLPRWTTGVLMVSRFS